MIVYSLLFLLLSISVTLRRDSSILYSRETMIVLLYSSLVALNNLNFTHRGIGLYGGLFHATCITQVFHIFIFLVSVLILGLTAFYSRRIWIKECATLSDLFNSQLLYNNTEIINKMGQSFKILEYPLILLFIITGSIFLVSTSDLVSLFLSIELQSYGLYLLCTLYRNSELSTSAGLTYFLLGGLSSCFILLATSLLYARSGITNLDAFYIITSLSNIANDYNNICAISKSFDINISLVLMSVGFLFKIAAAPFHFWSPDVYDAIPTIVTTFVAIIAKISIFIFLFELVHYTSNCLFTFKWTFSLLLSSILSLIIGTILGLTQSRIKRLFAYSTISHLGFILLALSINSLESIQSFIFYLMQYSISNLNAFILLIAIGFSLYPFIIHDDAYKQQYFKLLDRNNSPIQLISQIKGYFYINPLLALSLAITLFSLVGVPPLMGFFAKQMVLSAALDNGYVAITLVAITTSVISAVYYLNVIKQIFFFKPTYKLNPAFEKITLYCSIIPYIKYDTFYVKTTTFKVNNITLASFLTLTISNLTLVLLLFIFTPQEFLALTNILALIMFNV
jgi:NADH-ubiquinone oxidoreductase chain 2